jgi:hypothetical protein
LRRLTQLLKIKGDYQQSSITSSIYRDAVSFGKDIEEENHGLGSLIDSINPAIRIFKWASR